MYDVYREYREKFPVTRNTGVSTGTPKIPPVPRTSAVLRKTSSALVRAVRVQARHPEVGATARGLLQLRVRALVHVHARPPIVVQPQTVRAHAERRADRVDALVRAPGRPVPALVHVVASVTVAGQPGPGHAPARTPVAAPRVRARALARPVSVSQQALVYVCERTKSKRGWRM